LIRKQFVKENECFQVRPELGRIPVAGKPFLLVFSLLTLAPVGCGQAGQGPRLYPVKGQVFLKDKPATGARLVLVPVDDPKAEKPSAIVDENGSFQLATRQPGDGAPAGEYFVSITWIERRKIDTRKEDDTQQFVDKLGGRYADPKASKLKVKISEGPNDLPPFKLP
jgi:hypothetical protein